MSVPGSGRTIGMALAAVMTCVGIAGCAPTATTPGASSDAAALVERRCTVCHNMDRIDQATYDEAGWNSAVDRMRNKGAVVSEAEQKVIVTYLAGK